MFSDVYSMWYGEERPRWLGPLPYDYPAYLTGELPGDYGFDVAGLGKDPVAFQKYFKYVMAFAFFCFSSIILVQLNNFHRSQVNGYIGSFIFY